MEDKTFVEKMVETWYCILVPIMVVSIGLTLFMVIYGAGKAAGKKEEYQSAYDAGYLKGWSNCLDAYKEPEPTEGK